MGYEDSSAGKPLVVYGALRSGSTLLRLMLDAHPSLHCNGEHDYLFEYVRFQQAEKKWVLDRQKLLLDRIFRSHDLICPDTDDAKVAIDDLLNQLRTRSPGKLILMLHRKLGVALALLDEPLVIHLIRDPRDVAASSIGMGWAGNVYYGVDHWIGTETEWARISPDIPEESAVTIRFEHLIADPESQLVELCGFVGVDFSPVMLEYHQSTTYEPVDPRLASQWRTKRTQREISLIELRTGALLASSGFEASSTESLQLGSLEKARLWVDNKAHIWRVRIERYGLRDSLWVAAARRLGIERLAKSALFRMQERTKGYLK